MISIVIPALNEQEAIVGTVEAARQVCAQAGWDGYEIIVVDDGSSDRTGELAAAAGAKVLRHPSTSGYGRSLKDGIAIAHNDLIAISDADGTYPLDRLPQLMERINAGFDMAVGARTGQEYRESAVKVPLRLILRGLVEFTAGRRIPDINSGLRIFRRKTAMPFFSHLCNTFSFTTSMTLAYLMNGLYIAYVEIPYYRRVGSTKVRLFKDSLATMQYIVQAILYYNPIKLFIVICGIVALFSFAAMLWSVVAGGSAGYYFGLGGLLLSVLIFAMGLLADLLKQIMAK